MIRAMSELPEHVRRNREAWDSTAHEYVDPGRRNWAADAVTWGIWDVPEADVGMLPGDLAGLDTIELGCGTAYVSAWLARRGARPVGIDNSPAQLQTARALQAEHGLEFPLLLGNAEEVPHPDASFDFAISEYGASLWCDPYRWIPEAARLLRPGGRLAFLTNSVFMAVCAPDEDGVPATEQLVRPYFGMHRIEWPDDDSVEFHLPHGELFALLRAHGFAVEDLVEIRPPAASTTRLPFVTLEWARKWPSEEVWKAVKH
jgi:SAM-dependent methyltransferase